MSGLDAFDYRGNSDVWFDNLWLRKGGEDCYGRPFDVRNRIEFRTARYPESTHGHCNLQEHQRYPRYVNTITRIMTHQRGQYEGWKIIHFIGRERLVRHGDIGSPIYYYTSKENNDDPSKGELVTDILDHTIEVVR